MPQVVSDLQDRFVVEVDPTAEPADHDLALAKFLLRLVRKSKTSRSPAAPPAAAVEFSVFTGDSTERQMP